MYVKYTYMYSKLHVSGERIKFFACVESDVLATVYICMLCVQVVLHHGELPARNHRGSKFNRQTFHTVQYVLKSSPCTVQGSIRHQHLACPGKCLAEAKAMV